MVGSEIKVSQESASYQESMSRQPNSPTLMNLLSHHTKLSADQTRHLYGLVGQWQLLADLAFADLSLWVKSEKIANTLVCVAQCRPNTSATIHLTDQVGKISEESKKSIMYKALSNGRIITARETEWVGTIAFRSEAIPVRFQGELVGILVRQNNVSVVRLSSALEIAYRDSVGDLFQMVTLGNFPHEDSECATHETPRAGDGFIRLDTAGNVVYISPNALSAYRRMGYLPTLEGKDLSEITASLMFNRFESENLKHSFTELIHKGKEIYHEIDCGGATILLRGIALRPRGQNAGAIILSRDVTEVKIRDRALLSKDAIIREIHHRVKNNLQSVSALLRLQARKTCSPEAKYALKEAERRVGAIAFIHETLSMSVDEQVNFDSILTQLLPVMKDLGGAQECRVIVKHKGEIGIIPTERALSIAMILTELLQNALEHAFTNRVRGTIEINCERTQYSLTISVKDDGIGLPEDFNTKSDSTLGLQIMNTLIESDLKGKLVFHKNEPHGTNAIIYVPLD